MNAQQYDFTLPAYGSVELAVSGSMVKLLDSNGRVKIFTDSGASVQCDPGQGIRNFAFQKLKIVDLSGSANTGFVLVAGSEMIDDRITGEVSVIDGGKGRTAANQAFIGVGAIAGAGAYPHAQIWNPAGSGKNVFVSQIVLTLNTAAAIGCGLSNVQMATQLQKVKSKRYGGADGVAQFRTEANVAQLGGNQYAFYAYLPANQPVVWKPAEPFMLVPGSGLIACPGTVGVTLYATFDIYEEAI